MATSESQKRASLKYQKKLFRYGIYLNMNNFNDGVVKRILEENKGNPDNIKKMIILGEKEFKNDVLNKCK